MMKSSDDEVNGRAKRVEPKIIYIYLYTRTYLYKGFCKYQTSPPLLYLIKS